MATPSPTRDTMLMAYCATSVKRDRSITSAIPPTTASAPTPTGSEAATSDPKTNSSTANVSGAESTSLRWRSAASA